MRTRTPPSHRPCALMTRSTPTVTRRTGPVSRSFTALEGLVVLGVGHELDAIRGRRLA
ncbi:hypothetical protein DVA67_030705 [Solirubrobacter sp. CPCC 204708]|nr:hypothetical protein [Solirubrobacter deserti]